MIDAVDPFRRELPNLFGEACPLWIIRYGRRGEHLKIRVHVPPEHRERTKSRLCEYVQEFFAAQPEPRLSTTPENACDRIPAIDPEDEPSTLAPDHSLVWTTYRRSYVSLPPAPWLLDDCLVGHCYRCLASGCEFTLEVMGTEHTWSTLKGQKLLIRLLFLGLRASGAFPMRTVARYLQYHLDWLLRFFFQDSAARQAARGELEKLSSRSTPAVGPLRALFWPERGSTCLPTTNKRWIGDMANLVTYAARFRHMPGYQIDDFASDVTFVPTFKVLHGVANQIGLGPLEEAYVYALLLAAASDNHQPSVK